MRRGGRTLTWRAGRPLSRARARPRRAAGRWASCIGYVCARRAMERRTRTARGREPSAAAASWSAPTRPIWRATTLGVRRGWPAARALKPACAADWRTRHCGGVSRAAPRPREQRAGGRVMLAVGAAEQRLRRWRGHRCAAARRSPPRGARRRRRATRRACRGAPSAGAADVSSAAPSAAGPAVDQSRVGPRDRKDDPVQLRVDPTARRAFVEAHRRTARARRLRRRAESLTPQLVLLRVALPPVDERVVAPRADHVQQRRRRVRSCSA